MRLTLSKRWRIAFASAFVHGIHLTVIYIAPSLLLSPERKQLHISLSEATVPLNIYKLCNILCLPFAGLAVDYLGIRRCLLVGLLLGLLGGILYVVSPAVWLYIALSILFALSFMLSGTNVVIVLTSSWFSKSRGLAVGLVLAGYSCAASIAPIVLGYLVKLWKYRLAYLSILIVYSIFVLPVAYKVLEEKKWVKNYVESLPEEHLQRVDMEEFSRQDSPVPPREMSSLSEQVKLSARNNPSIHESRLCLSSVENTSPFWSRSYLRQVLRETVFSSRFMALAILYFTLQFALGFVYEHFVIFLEEDNHMRYERATVYFAILNTCALLSKVLGGYVADRTCRYRTLLEA
ncbi:MFS transporter [Galdieria sulphuraria]|uniref:MFS transporter n=1 Tax=Galdieria sulphuraria TaxID=130081 RepID=M2XZJ2_GALSU|nr:MFS transporter [Galdieria sulphuraria]EME28994.1 MFS transporter [Galdieria sulphuraria]|eukprot:XP_005705514.1 MFS transporter [Galdieria sulphuraria]